MTEHLQAQAGRRARPEDERPLGARQARHADAAAAGSGGDPLGNVYEVSIVPGSGSTSGLLRGALDDAAEAEAEREREVPGGVPGGIDRAREPEPRKTARGRRALY